MDKQFDADVIIIGSGALGANAAYELAKEGRSVIILEAGKHMQRWQLVNNFRNSSRKQDNNAPYPDESWAPTTHHKGYIENTGAFDFKPGMLKLVGGTTWHWAAAAWRYLPNDMKIKSLYGVGRDWPISYDDLEPYYVRAEYALGVSGSDTDDQSGQGGKAYPYRSKSYPVEPEAETYLFKRLKERLSPHGYHFIHEPHARPPRAYDGRPACQGNNNCMPICPIGTMYTGIIHVEKAIKEGAKLISEATVYKLEKGGGDQIVAVHYRTPALKDIRLTARYFIVAAHGLETPKLLLLSEVANSSDQVGRNLMDHTGVELKFLADEPLWMGRGPVQQGGIFNHRDGNFRRKHAPAKHAINNSVQNHTVAERLINAGVIGKELDERIRDESSRWTEISTVFEMLPHPTNTIRPNYDRKDALGIPMLKVHYEVDDYVKAAWPMVEKDYANFISILNGVVISNQSGWLNRDHIMGTVIMGDNRKDSVVDSDCRTFDHDNLFLATTGVIPAAGLVNPTLTGVALSIRIADTINKEI